MLVRVQLSLYEAEIKEGVVIAQLVSDVASIFSEAVICADKIAADQVLQSFRESPVLRNFCFLRNLALRQP